MLFRTRSGIDFLFPVLVFFFSISGYAQTTVDQYRKSWEAGLLTGGNWFFGDIGGRSGNGKKGPKDWAINEVNGYIGLYGIYNVNEYMGIRAGFGQTKVSGSDSKNQDKFGRYPRNLSFRSSIQEANIGVQFSWRRYFYNGLQEEQVSRFAPYLYTGIGLLHFNPKAFIYNQWVDLQPLGTEGQGMKEYGNKPKYKLTKLYIPVNAGASFVLTDRLHAGLELSLRKSFTDYIDDVSTNYIDPALFSNYLNPSDAALARALADRSGEINGGVNLFANGDPRGNKSNDSYVSILLTLRYFLIHKY